MLHPIPLTALPLNQTNPQLYSKVSLKKIWIVDDSLFAKNKVTVVNFWFSGCKCVGELSKLNELNEKLKEMGGEVVGINMDTLDNNEAIKEAVKAHTRT